MSTKIIQSYVYTKDKNFLVSTIYRESSVTANPAPWFYEIFGWELNDDNSKGKQIIEDSSTFRNHALEKHNEHCMKLIAESEATDV